MLVPAWRWWQSKYGESHRCTWNIRPDPAWRQSKMTNLVGCLGDLRRDSDPSVDEVETLSEEMQKMYHDTDQKLSTAMKCMTNFLQGAKELVRVYANRIKANQRAVWCLPQDNKKLYTVAWRGLWTGLKSSIKELMGRNVNYDRIEQRFDCAPDSEFMLDGQSPNFSSHINSKSCGENHLNKVSRTATSDIPYPSRPNHWSTTSHHRTRIINALMRLESRWSSMRIRSQKEILYAVGHPNKKHCDVWNIHVPTSPTLLLLQETDNQSYPTAPSTVNRKKLSLPRLVPSSVGEDGKIRYQTAVIGYEGIDGNIRRNSTALDIIQVKGCLTKPESSHVKWIIVWNGTAGFIAHYPQCPDRRWTQRTVRNTSTHRLQRRKHCHGSTTSP